jgi:hypothetical protein
MNGRFRTLSLLLKVSTLLAVVITPAIAQPNKSGSQARRQKPSSSAAAIDPVLKAAIKSAPDAREWPNCDIACLLDLGNVTVKPDGTVLGEYRLSYKLFNERARRMAEVNISFNASYQHIRIIQARTIKKDGRIMNVKPSDIRISSRFSEYLIYDDSKTIGFSLPGIEDDCVIDYTFQLITRPLVMPGHFWQYWGFSDLHPVSVSRLTLHVPSHRPIRYQVYNSQTFKPRISEKNGIKTYQWEMKNIPPIPTEPAMPPLREVKVWMEATSLSSWQEISQWIWKLKKPQAVADRAIRETVSKLISGKKTDEEKARAIYDWVANRVRYVGLEFGLSAFRPYPASEVHARLYGDCKDKTTLLITMLEIAGIKAHPVLLYSQERRPTRTLLPTLSAFDHCIALAEVDGKQVWLDATAETVAYGDIPEGDRGADAFIVREGSGEFQTIPHFTPEENGSDGENIVHLHADGSAVIESKITLRGGAGQQMRAYSRSLTPDQRKTLMQGLAQLLSVGSTVQSYQIPDGTDKNGAFTLQLKVTAPNFARRSGNLLLVPANVGLTENSSRNPFISETRTWPIVIERPNLDRSKTVIHLPEGYSLEGSPEDVSLSNRLFDFKRSILPTEDTSSLTIHWSSATRHGRIPPSEYAPVRQFFNSVLKASEEPIVLRKRR